MQTLSEHTIAVVKATVPALEAQGLAITRAMYARLFQTPAIRDLFNQSHQGGEGAQPKALAAAVLAYARNIDNLGALGPTVERIAQKHVGLQIQPQHYPYVAEALLAAIAEVLGDAATPEVMAAWTEAYGFLADILIGRERELYQDLAHEPGGWSGWRPFAVRSKVKESAVITSFRLEPVDGQPVIRHKPGQYLTFWFEIPGQPPIKRNYSISSAPDGRGYRISVKRELRGLVSNWLHGEVAEGTVLKVAPPVGDFHLHERPERPLVLLSGGVGLTPMQSMLDWATEAVPELPVHYVHGTEDGSTHAMGQHVRALAARKPALRATIFYRHPRPEDVQGQHYDEAGLVTPAWLAAHTPLATADYYLCGPRGFLAACVRGLCAQGVSLARIHHEFFGPAEELLAA